MSLFGASKRCLLLCSETLFGKDNEKIKRTSKVRTVLHLLWIGQSLHGILVMHCVHAHAHAGTIRDASFKKIYRLVAGEDTTESKLNKINNGSNINKMTLRRCFADHTGNAWRPYNQVIELHFVESFYTTKFWLNIEFSLASNISEKRRKNVNSETRSI